MTGSKNNSLTAAYYIVPEGKTEIVGFISRGHRKINAEHRQKGYFKEALKGLEARETRFFRRGGFEEYRRKRYEEIVVGSSMKPYGDEILGLRQPAFIEHTLLPSVMASLLKNGYSLSKHSLHVLRQNGLPEKADWDQTIKFLNHHPELKNRVVAVLFKNAPI